MSHPDDWLEMRSAIRHDGGDRRLLAKILSGLGPRWPVRGYEPPRVPVNPGPGSCVIFQRCPRRPPRRVVTWRAAGGRDDLNRWSRRTLPPEQAVQVALHEMISAPASDAGRAMLAEIKARVGTWPPPIVHEPGASPQDRRARARPLVTVNGLTAPPGCSHGRGAPCVPAPGGRWRCPRCGAITAMIERWPGPRLAACLCAGSSGVVCLHPAAPSHRAAGG